TTAGRSRRMTVSWRHDRRISPSGSRASPSDSGGGSSIREMVGRVDLTPFGFTPTESLIYEVLLTGGPGTGYTIARAAGLARANAYSALEGLVAKGAAPPGAGRT